MRGFWAGGILILIATVGTRVDAADGPVPPPMWPTPPTPQQFPGTPVPPPMWPEEDLPPGPPRPQHRNLAMMIAGIVITGVGVAISMVGAGLSLGNDASNGDVSAGIFMLSLGSTALPAIGIPLWVNGARSWHSWDPVDDASSRLATGARSATLRWAF